MGCGEPKADSRSSEQRELPASKRYVPTAPVFPALSSSGRLAGEDQIGALDQWSQDKKDMQAGSRELSAGDLI